MKDFDKLIGEINNGILGRNQGVPTGFDRLDKFVSIRKRIYTLIFGATGTGKSAFCHNAYILNPADYYIKHKPKDFNFKVILFSMERSKIYILAKWLSRKIFLDTGEYIPIPKMLGWWDIKLTSRELEMIKSYEEYVTELLTVVDIVEGPQNPTGIYKYVKQYAEQTGKIERVSEFHTIYTPNHNNQIVIPIVDHIGLTKPEKSQSKKEAIDRVSEYFQYFRDFLEYSPVAISQVNRDLSNPIYQKMDSFEPNLDQVKESGRPSEDSDCVISLFQPTRYKTKDPGYQVDNFINPESGADCFRRIKILKNTYGESDVGIGMAFEGATGIFKELPRPKNMDGFDYSSLFDKSYFL